MPVAVFCATVVAACGVATHKRTVPGGNAAQGKRLIEFYGCGACHEIGGIATANGHVGPPLHGLAGRDTIAGKLSNTQTNLVHWIMNPQKIVPGNDMPELGITDAQARNIAAYLYSQ